MKKIALILIILFSFSVSAQVVRMETVLGNIDIEMRADVAPNTVANFLKYVTDDDYKNSYIHRSIENFIIQGGGFNYIDGVSGTVPTDAPIVNEFNLSNVRGTIAMAKLGGDPDSATSQWFFNVADNSGNLDNQNGGFTVFGTVVSGMDVVDAINQLQTWNAGGSLSNLPLIDYSGSGSFIDNLVTLTDVYILDEELQINMGLSGAWFNPQVGGQGFVLEMLPKVADDAENSAFVAWFTFDTQAPADDAVATIGYAGHRWLTGQAGVINSEEKSITFDVVLSTNGVFDSVDDNSVVAHTVIDGSLKMTFTDCSHASISYNLVDANLSRTFDVVRVAQNIELCERLSREAPLD